MASCKNMIVHCMDFRIQPAIEKWLDEKGYAGDTDRISFAGSCEEKDLVMRMVDLSCRIHGTEHIILTMHEDCGAYGGSAAFESPELERDTLVADMMKVRRLVRNKHPKVAVTTIWIIRHDDTWKLVEVQPEE